MNVLLNGSFYPEILRYQGGLNLAGEVKKYRNEIQIYILTIPILLILTFILRRFISLYRWLKLKTEKIYMCSLILKGWIR